MKHILIVIIIILLNQIGFTQIRWVKSLGGEGVEWPLNIITDDAYNIYLSANFQNSIDVDPSAEDEILNATLDSESFVLKLNGSGDFIKVDHLIDERAGLSISRDENNNIYYLYSVDGWSDFILEKRDPQGAILNQKNVFGSGISSFQLSKNVNSNLFPIKNTYCYEFNTDNVSLHDQELNCISDKYSLTEPSWKGYIAYGSVNLKNDIYYFTCEVNGTVILNWGNNTIEIGESDFFNDTFWKTTTYIVTMNLSGELVEVIKINEGGMQDPSQTNQNLAWNIEADNLGNFYIQNLLWGTYTYGIGENEKTISSVGGPAVSNSIIQRINKASGEINSYWLGENANFTDLIIDENDNIVLSGIYVNTIDLDLNESSSISITNENVINNSFIVKYNSDFEYVEHVEFNDLEIHKIDLGDKSIYFYGLFNADTLILNNQTFLNNGNSDLIFGEYEFNPTSSNQDISNENISVYPNPFQNEINLISPDLVKDVSIYDFLGRKQKITFDRFSEKINVSTLKSGSYILIAYTEKGIINKIVIKNEN